MYKSATVPSESWGGANNEGERGKNRKQWA